MDLLRVQHAWPTFCGKMTRSVDKGRAVGVIHLDFSKTSAMVFCNIPMYQGRDGQLTRCIKKIIIHLDDQA